MTPTLVRHTPSHAETPPRVNLDARARDWSEIQERMLVPLYETVHERLEVGPGTRLLGLGCGSGLALLMAASRGAAVTGVETARPERLALARARLLPDTSGTRARTAGRTLTDSLRDITGPYDVLTAFEPIGYRPGAAERLGRLLAAAAPLAGHGAAVVLSGWGPPERCATSSVLRVATKPAEPRHAVPGPRPAARDDLEEIAHRVGLRPDGSGRVSCPFGYADLDSAVRGLLSTGLFDAAITATDQERVDKELTEALHPHQRTDGTVRMPNVFRYLIARTP